MHGNLALCGSLAHVTSNDPVLDEHPADLPLAPVGGGDHRRPPRRGVRRPLPPRSRRQPRPGDGAPRARHRQAAVGHAQPTSRASAAPSARPVPLPPIYLATLRDKMLDLAVEVADGAIWANASRSAHADAGRPRSRPTGATRSSSPTWCPTVIDADKAAARADPPAHARRLRDPAELPQLLEGGRLRGGDGGDRGRPWPPATGTRSPALMTRRVDRRLHAVRLGGRGPRGHGGVGRHRRPADRGDVVDLGRAGQGDQRAVRGLFLSKEAQLDDDIRLLGRVLGDVVREQAGERVFDLVERVRRCRWRCTATVPTTPSWSTCCARWRSTHALNVVRAFALLLLAGQHRRGRAVRTAPAGPPDRRRRRRSRAASPRRSTACSSTRVGTAELAARCSTGSLVSPVITAHPTEVARRTVLDTRLEVARLLHRARTARR